MILGRTARAPIPAMLRAAESRVGPALRHGNDYSASLGISAVPVLQHRPRAPRNVMQVAVGGTGAHLGRLHQPAARGDAAQRRETWALHARLAAALLERGFYQGVGPARPPAAHAALPHQLRLLPRGVRRRRPPPGRPRRPVRAGHLETADVADQPATARALAR
ncbi:hypothetical protein QJS66_10740 [Kocuria rhizophila]|nr:hypothetical protein QJS66_10740 [Kocuria rhizophila]